MLSIFDIYKIGVGPSSSHTNGPMIAGHQFIEKNAASLSSIKRIQVDLYGSLSLTGKGHHTDRASILGLSGNTPESIDIAAANEQLQQCIKSKTLILNNTYQIEFDIENDVVFNKESLPLHENAMTISAYDSDGRLIDNESYFSIGGGFIATEKQLKSAENNQTIEVELPFTSADELLLRAQENGLSIGSLVLRNELAFRSAADTQKKADKIWTIMSHCIERGLTTEGILDGGLHLTRRAPALLKHLEANQSLGVDPMEIMDWVNLFAFAVSEENAAGGQIITSPTNGASGVIPAVLNYYHTFIRPLKSKQIEDFIAVSGAIGMLYKMNASISGAEVGCQGEIGVSSSMAAAGLTALRGGSNEQVCMAAEIAMEHSLGMTCDPIAGLVQVPCIERNAMGAMKAINASRMALKRTSKCLISLDKVIETMFKTGKDMNKKYRETSLGGLALIHLALPCE
ncbi:L-serine ammonia-lyase [Vibrio sp. MACH09]|uniref:L-serine ammonia-lyase n=1 Tax=Vibrio sp. MACH09 TaxID=3025122 RepID=UPI002792D849|nr:L-serine ammonia-lyase [Vibrio sp. MACH09]GLO63316.1 L-serine ammonia-lyase [Vibrio sp. MACH09]